MVFANTPYLLHQENDEVDRGILNMLPPGQASKELTHLSLSFGSDNVVALAEMTKLLK